ncbi:MAG TPA: M20 family metallo-hydrolase [Bacteroidia bacterium]|nr:M20 family metallo-hydrolase [Bacteroidia bacterium]
MDQNLYDDAVALLKQLITIESFSRQEDRTADAIQAFFSKKKINTHRKLNNVWVFNKHYNSQLPTILLNSHHDTVKPNTGYTNNPFEPKEESGKLYGLGSNDAGGCLVSLIVTFINFYENENLKYNLVFAATAEEEISGTNGLELIIPELGPLDFAIVGEPTQMHLAIAEKGLLVLDCIAYGRSGHAARNEGENAIYNALKDIEWFKTFQFPKQSELFGSVKMTVTVIKAGSQHNVIPNRCDYTVDVRVTDAYKNEEIVEVIKKHVSSEVTPRSVRLKPSSIDKNHLIVRAGVALGRNTYGSPTTSDQALLNIPSLKIGPGDSARSHTANEFIYLNEIKEGIDIYTQLLQKIITTH